MAATTQLARISGLVERLGSVGRKQRGMTIQAEDWNTLVDVISGILEVDRAQEQTTSAQLEERFATRTHEHLGQVTASWLSPELQDRLGSGTGSGSVPTRTALAEANEKIRALGDQVAKLTVLVEQQQRILDRLSVDSVDRSRTLREFDSRFAGVENLRTLVDTVSGQVGGLTQNVAEVLRLRSVLSDPAGNPINVSQIRSDLDQLNRLSENLRGVDGSFVRMRDIELRLSEVADVAGVGGSGRLDTRFAGFSAEIEERLVDRIAERSESLKLELIAASADSDARILQQVDGIIETTRTGLSQTLDARTAESEARLATSFDQKLAAARQSIRSDTSAETGAAIQQVLSTIPGQVKSSTDAAAVTLRSELSTDLRGFVSSQVTTQVSAAETRLGTRVSSVESRVLTIESGLPTRITTAVTEAVALQETRLTDRFSAETRTATATLDASIDSRVKSSAAEITASVETLVGPAVDERLSTLDTRISQAVAGATRSLPSQVEAEVKAEIAALNLSQQIQDSAGAVTLQFRRELSQVLADQQAKTSSAINSAVTLLRGEIAATAKTTTETLRADMDRSTTTLRTDLTRTVDERIRTGRVVGPVR